ncbi:MAG: DUF5606 domain-containing protein [Bacteroidota bacterium]
MSIEIKDVVALTGSPGLFRVVKSDDRAIIIEAMDDRKRRQLVKGNMMVSKLVDVSIYTNEDSEPLVHILQAVKEKYGSELPVSKKSSKTELMEFLESVLPDYHQEKVYPSNVKKLISWYKVLSAFDVNLELPDEEEEQESEAAEAQVEEAAESTENSTEVSTEEAEVAGEEAES